MSVPGPPIPVPSKIKCCEDLQGESSVEKDILRSQEFWFEDGSVVLQAENTQFRVHRTILAAKSDIFGHMFMLPQPTNQPMVEGCPLVVCMEDLAKDWQKILMFIYHSTKLEHDGAPFRFEITASMLRLGKKYEMDVILRARLTRLHAGIPTHRNRITTHWWKWNFFDDMDLLFAHINLAEELGIQSILPMCYYTCVHGCITEELVDGFVAPLEENSAVLNAATRKLLLVARDSLLPAHKRLAWGWLTSASSDFAKECQSVESCRKTLNEAINLYGARSIHTVAPDSYGWLLDYLHEGLCKRCNQHVRSNYDAGMENLWQEIPLYFGLPRWEDLRDFAD